MASTGYWWFYCIFNNSIAEKITISNGGTISVSLPELISAWTDILPPRPGLHAVYAIYYSCPCKFTLQKSSHIVRSCGMKTGFPAKKAVFEFQLKVKFQL